MSKLHGTDKIRNVAFIGHSQTGKTTLIESLLFATGSIKEQGSLDKGTMTTDYEEEEIERKMSVRSAIAYSEYDGHKINFLDTPGLSDFSADVRAAFRSVESIIALVDAENGIEIQTKKNWKLAEEYKMPRAVVISKLDKERANFQKTIENIEKSFGKRVVPINIPIGEGKNARGVADILSQKAFYPDGKKNKVENLPEEVKAKVEELRVQMIETACETDEKLMEKYFDGKELTEEEVFEGIKQGIKEQNFIPVLCSAGESTIGSIPIADFIIHMMPKPDYKGEILGASKKDGTGEVKKKTSDDEKFSAFVFKTMVDPYAGKTSFIKIHSGKLRVGDEVINVQTEEKIKIGHLYTLKGKNRDEVSEASTGDIVAIAKLEHTSTNHTLCDSHSDYIFYEGLRIHSPISFTAVHAEDKKHEEKMNNALHKLIEEDPSFVVRFNKETKETVIENNGQLQTEIALRKIEAHNNIKIARTVPKVAYRETVRKKIQASYRHKKQSGGHGQFGEVHLEISPRQRGDGFEFENNIVGGAIPKNFIPAVEKGVVEAMESGVLAGYPVMDIKVNLFDGKYHDVDSSEMAFKIAGRGAMRECMNQANPVLLEPVMKAVIQAPDSYTGGIMSDLNSKRARVHGSNVGGDGLTEIEAFVPLSEMLKYSIDLKGITSGEGTFEMEFDHYQELQGREAETIIKERETEKDHHE